MDDLENPVNMIQMSYVGEESFEINTEDINSEDLNPDEIMKLVQNYSSQELIPEDSNQPDEFLTHLIHTPDLSPVDLGYNFEITMEGDSNSWLYKSNKIFIKMNSTMTIKMSCNPFSENLFLRAMILFDNPSEMHLPVKRCANHITSDSSSKHPKEHILKCVNPYASYFGKEDGVIFQDRLSVVVPVDITKRDEESGNITAIMSYEFTCQNSCTSGINRKSTSIVFTLEDQNRKLFGKKAVPFKVCSCPKRDAERDFPSKRKTTEPFPKGKRPKYPTTAHLNKEIKAEPEDADAPTSPISDDLPKPVTMNITMPDAECMIYILENGFNKICGKMADTKWDRDHLEHYRKHAEALKKQMKSMKRATSDTE